jgi:hypothetical protein
LRQQVVAIESAVVSKLALAGPEAYLSIMSLRCYFGVHRPLLTSILRRGTGFVALCDSCSMPLQRSEEGGWKAAEPLAGPSQAARRPL